jgi:large subunit ribosomal protein L23
MVEGTEFEILLHPYVTEKTMTAIDGTAKQDLTDGNRLEFIVKRSATKRQIKDAFESLFDVKVEKVNTKIRKDGKHAVIKLKEGYSAKDVGDRIGVF